MILFFVFLFYCCGEKSRRDESSHGSGPNEKWRNKQQELLCLWRQNFSTCNKLLYRSNMSVLTRHRPVEKLNRRNEVWKSKTELTLWCGVKIKRRGRIIFTLFCRDEQIFLDGVTLNLISCSKSLSSDTKLLFWDSNSLSWGNFSLFETVIISSDSSWATADSNRSFSDLNLFYSINDTIIISGCFCFHLVVRWTTSGSIRRPSSSVTLDWIKIKSSFSVTQHLENTDFNELIS